LGNDSIAARERIIDAAEECFQRYGMVRTRVEDIARAAHCSRATIYRYFEGRDEVILAVLLRESERFGHELTQRLRQYEKFEDFLIEGVIHTVESIRSHEHFALFFSEDSIGITNSIAGGSDALFQGVSHFLAPVMQPAIENGKMHENLDVQEVTEWILRIVLSLLSVEGPSHRNTAELREYLRVFMLPALTPPANLSPQVSSSSWKARS